MTPPTGPRIGFIISTSFAVVDNGGALKRAQVASALAAVSDLHLIALDAAPTEEWTGSRPFTEPFALRLPFGGQAQLWRIGENTNNREQARFWRSLDLDLLVLDWAGQARLLAHVPATVPSILNTQNVESDVVWSVRGTGWRVVADVYRWLQLRSDEAKAISRSVETWCVSEVDTETYRRRFKKATFRFMPNVAPDTAFVADPLVGTAGRAAFVGSLRYRPNQVAVEELTRIADELHRRGIPHHIDIIGAGDPGVDLSGHPSLELRGFIEDLPAALQDYSAVVVPVTTGGGTKTKILQAMAAGRAVITTPEGANGIAGLVDGTHAIVRPLGSSFVEAVARGIQDPVSMADMGRRAQALVHEHYSMEKLTKAVADAVRTWSTDHARSALGTSDLPML